MEKTHENVKNWNFRNFCHFWVNSGVILLIPKIIQKSLKVHIEETKLVLVEFVLWVTPFSLGLNLDYGKFWKKTQVI